MLEQNTPSPLSGGPTDQRKSPAPYPARTRTQLVKPAQAMNLGSAARRPAASQNAAQRPASPVQTQSPGPADIFAQAGDFAPQAASPLAAIPGMEQVAQSLGMGTDELTEALEEIFARRRENNANRFTGVSGKFGPFDPYFGDTPMRAADAFVPAPTPDEEELTIDQLRGWG